MPAVICPWKVNPAFHIVFPCFPDSAKAASHHGRNKRPENKNHCAMKAVVCTAYGPPGVLQLRDVEKPVPGDKEILIRVRATTVAAADFRIRSFTVPLAYWLPARLALGIRKPRNPILGVELCGEVESVGRDVTRFKAGDRVFAATLKDFGAYAEYKRLPADGPVAIMPAGLSHEEAAALPIGARTALHYLRKADIRRGQKVLVYGASGSVGTYAVQLARYFGAEVTGVCSSANAALVHSLGAAHVLDYAAPDFLQKLGLYDVIFVAVDKLPFPVCNKHLHKGGVYQNVTSPFKSPAMIRASLLDKKKVMMGENVPESAEYLQAIKTLVESGALRPVIDRVYTLDQVVEAHQYVDKGHKKGNVVISVA